MNKKQLILTIIFVLLIVFSCSLSTYAGGRNDFKVVGYYSDIFDNPVEELQFDKVTHIIYAFLIPKEDGTLVDVNKPDKLKALITQCHENNVKVLIAIGGWSYNGTPLDATFEKIAASDDVRENFIKQIMKFVEAYDLDGVDLDWEYPNEESSQNYEDLILELSKALKKEDKYLTAALCGAWSQTEGPSVAKAVTEKCLQAFDWINIMAYDMNNADHSPYWFAETSIDYWLYRGMPQEKIVIGVPFYAKPSWKQYRDLVKENPEHAYVDYVKGDTIDSYYNGIPTIKEKTRLALNKASGIMIFDVNEDVKGELSLLKAMNDTIDEFNKMDQDNILFLDLNNRQLNFVDEDGLGKPFVDENNRTLVPVRKCIEAIDGIVHFDEGSRTVVAEKDGIILEIPIDEKFIRVNGEKRDLDTKAVIKEGRSYVPVRYVYETFNYQVQWQNGSRTIKINN